MIRGHDTRRGACWGRVAALFSIVVLAGCSGPKLMPTPNVYRHRAENLFATVPPVFQTNSVDLIYVTDRAWQPEAGGARRYGYQRSESLAYGSCTVKIGDEVPWSTLVAESRSTRRKTPLPLSLAWVEERGRFPETPLPLEKSAAGYQLEPQVAGQLQVATRSFQSEVESRLALTPQKEAYVFVHGFNNDFNYAAFVAAQLWHFLPREGVPIVYTWPAGRGGLRGYTYDRESSEFTVLHLKQMLRALAACPNLEKIHIIAHSRGTDVASSALRELLVEQRGTNGLVAPVPKIDNLVLAAPDMDVQVALQRVSGEHVPMAVRRLTVYVCEEDRAVNLANWFFQGMRRLGQVRSRDFTEAQRRTMRRLDAVQIIDARVKTDFLGHGYFHSNPAVSSDLIQLLRENCNPGSSCRPMEREDDLFWKITDNYLLAPSQ